MTETLNIYIAQLNPTVGAISLNVENIKSAYRTATGEGAELVLTPELSVIGYPPEDLVLKPAFQREAMAAVNELAALTLAGPALIVGSCWVEDGTLYNAIIMLADGVVSDIRYKAELPNYGVFDEKRVFASAPTTAKPIVFNGVKLGVMICEDMWYPKTSKELADAGAEILLVPTCSPYETNKQDDRYNHAFARVEETALPLIFANQICGQDELVFDGSSFVMDISGDVRTELKDWAEDGLLTRWEKQATGWACVTESKAEHLEGLAEVYQACMLGLRDYVEKNHFPGVLIGLSGGVDSALSAAIAVDALGSERVECVMMPSKYTSGESMTDADQCAEALGVNYRTIAIKEGVDAFDAMLSDSFDGMDEDTTEENIQSRIRGMLLMALSNKLGHMVLTTGNKSEMSVGYATLYGDMCGGYSVLKDVYKTMCFDMCHWRNANLPRDAKGKAGEVIPVNIIIKPPTAELRDNQKDEDSLPPYDALDDMLIGLVDEELSVADVAARGHDAEEVARIERLLNIAEYKRRQAPPGVKITRRNFGRDRRYPITNGFRSADKR